MAILLKNRSYHPCWIWIPNFKCNIIFWIMLFYLFLEIFGYPSYFVDKALVAQKAPLSLGYASHSLLLPVANFHESFCFCYEKC